MKKISLILLNILIPKLKKYFKKYGVKGLSKMRVNDLDEELFKQFSEDELGLQFNVRGYSLTKKGEIILAKYQNIVDKHPKKSGIIKYLRYINM